MKVPELITRLKALEACENMLMIIEEMELSVPELWKFTSTENEWLDWLLLKLEIKPPHRKSWEDEALENGFNVEETDVFIRTQFTYKEILRVFIDTTDELLAKKKIENDT